jgi:hypothetical protein
MSGTNTRQRAPAARRSRAWARRKFLSYYAGGFDDPDYVELERSYKWSAHRRWSAELGRSEFRALLAAGKHREIAERAVRIEGKTNLLFSFEKMALRDAVRSAAGAERFARGLAAFLYGAGGRKERFEAFTETLASLPRRQTRVLTWPLQTVFGFIAQPGRHIFMKPRVTRLAARKYGFDLPYASRPNWETYASLLAFAAQVREDVEDLGPRDMIDLQSFIWVMGSDEYPD